MTSIVVVFGKNCPASPAKIAPVELTIVPFPWTVNPLKITLGEAILTIPVPIIGVAKVIIDSFAGSRSSFLHRHLPVPPIKLNLPH